MKHIFSAILGVMAVLSAQSQNIAINETGNQPDTSAMLDISSTTRGFLMPRMTKTQRNAIALPATGLMVFQTGPDSTGLHYYNGTQWLWLATADLKTAWSLTGNNGTDSTINFLGTTDNKPIMLRQNNLPMGQLNTKTHNFFVGGASGNVATGMQNTAYGDSTLTKNTTAIGNTAVGYRAMVGSAATTGSYNSALGYNALSNVSTGLMNTALGVNTLGFMTEGNYNIAIGSGASEFTKKGDVNIAIGLHALRTNDSANYNIAIGNQALYYNDSSKNTAIGHFALTYNNRHHNTAVGYYAGHYNSYAQSNPELGIENTYVGHSSGFGANTGSKNVVIGFRAMGGGGTYLSDDPGNFAYKRNVVIGDSAMIGGYGSDNVAIGFQSLSKGGGTSQHVAVGGRALHNSYAGYPNTAIGYSSQDSNSTGAANTSLGSYSLTKNTAGVNNTAIGNATMYEAVNEANPSWVTDNTAVGNDALRRTRYYGETAIGAGALRNDTGSVYNTAVGFLSMYNHLRGNYNTAVGTNTLRYDTIGISNTAVGMNSLMNHKNGDNNTAVGVNTLYLDEKGFNNTALGTQALMNHKSGDNNTAVGVNALFSDTISHANVAVGVSAMFNHKKNDYNTSVGFESMVLDEAGYANTAMGYRSLRNSKNGIENTAIGVGALEFTDSSMYNVAIGRSAMMGKGGRYNTAIGYMASGYNNSAATSSNYYVTGTTSIGHLAGLKNFGNDNTFVGKAAGQGASSDSLSGIENTGVGSYSIQYNTTGSKNTALGQTALNANTTGSSNTAIGYSALSVNQTGSFNTAIGNNANTSTASLSNAAAIGANAYVAQNNSLVLGSINGVNSATADTKVGIGTTTPDSTFSVADKFTVGNSGTVQYDNTVSVMNYMFKSGGSNANRMVVAHSPAFPNYGLQYQDAGDKFNFLYNGSTSVTIDLGLQRVGIGVASPSYQLQLSADGAGKLLTSTWTITSDMRLKTLDGNYTKGLQDILKLNTIMYHYAKGNARNLSPNEQGIGFSAQDVQKVFPEAVTQGEDGYLSLNIHPILIAYVNAIKEQQEQIEELKKKAEENSKDELIEKLMKRIEALEAKTAATK